MTKISSRGDRQGIFAISALAVFVAGLCCMTPVVLVLLGLASVSFAADLGDVLYGKYAWLFRIAALGFVALALWVYFRRKGICTLGEVQRQRNRVINTTLLVLTFATGGYLIWNYVVVHFWGISAGLPWAQWHDERWAVPAAAAILVLGVILFFVLSREPRKTGK
jgi:uncharacterized membrane protein